MKLTRDEVVVGFKMLFKTITGIGKAVWRSTLSILYLVVFSFLLFALIGYYGYEQMVIDNNFLVMIGFLTDYWKVFWWIFFASNMYSEWRFV